MTQWKGTVRRYENAPGFLEARPIPIFQFQQTDLSRLLIDETSTNSGGLLTKQQAIFLLEQMYTIRDFEEMFAELRKPAAKRTERFRGYSFSYRGAAHLYKGEEAVAAPISLVLGKGDYISSTHRGHGHAVGIRLPLDQMIAEMLGKYDACCKGKGGSMHITGTGETGIVSLGANGVVGGGYGIAVGAARALQLDGDEKIVFSFAGDGSTATGSSHEAMVVAKRYNAPIAFMWEDNGAGMTGRVDQVLGFKKSYDIVRRAWAYDIPGEVVNGMDVLAVLDALKRAELSLRKGEGPRAFVFPTYRYLGHSTSDDKTSYTTKEENAEWEAQDSIKRFEEQLEKAGVMTRDDIKALKTSVQKKMDALLTECGRRPVPPLETLTTEVYANTFDSKFETLPSFTKPAENHKKRFELDGYRLAIFEGLDQLRRLDKGVVLFGEDVANYGGAFSVTAVDRIKGPFLVDLYPNQIWNMPIAEEGIVASAIGMGMVSGQRYKPIAEVMYQDFLRQAANAIHLQGKNIRYMFGGQHMVNATIRATMGGNRGYACQHGGSVESELLTTPGLIVAVPSNPFDAKGLLATAVLSNDFVMFLEDQILYNTPNFMWGNEVPEELYSIPFGKANRVREGKDITIWTYGRNVDIALRAARDLGGQGIECDVIDPRTLSPLDLETVYESVRKTGRLLCVSQGTDIGNICHTVASKVAQNVDYPVNISVLTAPDCPPPTAENLEKIYAPDKDKVMAAARALYERQQHTSQAGYESAGADGALELLRRKVTFLAEHFGYDAQGNVSIDIRLTPEQLREAQRLGLGKGMAEKL